MKKNILIGESDFKYFIESNGYYADKSLLIKKMIINSNKIILLPRPRRFGKTLNLSMLKYFFERTDADKNNNALLFKDLKIEKDPIFAKHQAKYPVIYLTFKDVKSLNFDEAYQKICRLISDEYERILIDYENNNNITNKDKKYISKIMNSTASKVEYEDSLKELTKILFNIFDKKILILIDEYDTPIHAAYQYKYYNEMNSFMRGFLSGGLKDNVNLYKSVLTGILRVSKESIFSGLNLLGVYSVISNKFSDSFGLTESEVKQILQYYDKQSLYKDIKDWYDGYKFGKTKIYNPWSVFNYVAKPEDGLISYWVNTASNDLLRELVQHSEPELRDDIKLLMEGKELEARELKDNIAFGNLRNKRDNAISFFYFTGYLTYTNKRRESDIDKYDLKIPNKEVSIIYKNIIQNWIIDSNYSKELDITLEALLKGDIDLFEEKLNEFVIETLSYFDANKKNVEAVYQAFILGTFINLRDKYQVKSNNESGYGRYDICLIPHNKNEIGIIMELKKKLKKHSVEETLESALKQIEEKKYETELKSVGIKKIYKIAVTFDGKRCWLKNQCC